jgi:hypothetical protein
MSFVTKIMGEGYTGRNVISLASLNFCKYTDNSVKTKVKLSLYDRQAGEA